MRVTCPRCGTEVAAADVNPGRDVAFCRPCGEAFALSALLDAAPATPDQRPVPGAYFSRTPDGFVAGATSRHPLAVFLIPFAVAWISVALGGSLAVGFARKTPSMLPLLFAFPFLIFAVVLIAACVHLTVGRAEIRVKGDLAEVFTGVGGLGRRRRFRWGDVSSAEESFSGFPWSGIALGHEIVLTGARRISFGATLRSERRYFVLRAIQRMLAERT